jgi:hypothetical protein
MALSTIRILHSRFWWQNDTRYCYHNNIQPFDAHMHLKMCPHTLYRAQYAHMYLSTGVYICDDENYSTRLPVILACKSSDDARHRITAHTHFSRRWIILDQS